MQRFEWTHSIEVYHIYGRILDLVNSGIFHPENTCNVFLKSATIEVFIMVNDLLQKSNGLKKFDGSNGRVQFTDDVDGRRFSEIKDVTDLIKYGRDAVCHQTSKIHYVDPVRNGRVTFGFVYGRSRYLFVGGESYETKYDDDLAFTFGPLAIYLKRHLIRASNEAWDKLLTKFDEVALRQVQSMGFQQRRN